MRLVLSLIRRFFLLLPLQAVSVGMGATRSIIDSISTLATKHGRPKRRLAVRPFDESLDEEIRKRSSDSFEAILSNASLDKFARDKAFQSVAERLARSYREELENDSMSISNSNSGEQSSSSSARPVNFATVRAAIDRCWQRQFRERILTKRSRCDGRLLDQLRLIRCETNLHEPLHGSSLFQRWDISSGAKPM